MAQLPYVQRSLVIKQLGKLGAGGRYAGGELWVGLGEARKVWVAPP